jgi:hypothetical protein
MSAFTGKADTAFAMHMFAYDLKLAALRNHLSKSLAFSDELQIRFPAYFRRSNDIAAQSKTIHVELDRRGHRKRHIGGDA